MLTCEHTCNPGRVGYLWAGHDAQWRQYDGDDSNCRRSFFREGLNAKSVSCVAWFTRTSWSEYQEGLNHQKRWRATRREMPIDDQSESTWRHRDCRQGVKVKASKYKKRTVVGSQGNNAALLTGKLWADKFLCWGADLPFLHLPAHNDYTDYSWRPLSKTNTYSFHWKICTTCSRFNHSTTAIVWIDLVSSESTLHCIHKACPLWICYSRC